MVNEKRLIDANEAYEIARGSGRHSDFARSRADLTSLEEVLEDCTTVDAVEVVHGRWKPTTDWLEPDGIEYNDGYLCSECGEWVDTEHKSNYCPDCGAKMDGERKDNG